MLFVHVEGQTYLREAQRVKTISLRGLACRFAERVAGRAIKALLSGQRRLAQNLSFLHRQMFVAYDTIACTFMW